MFLFKKIVSAFLLPLPIGLFLLLIAFYFLMRNSYKKAKVFLFLGLSWFVLLSFQPISNAIISPLENSYKALLEIPKVQYILVLGSGHKTNENLSITSQLGSTAVVRLNEGIKIYKKLDNAKLIVSGYKGFDKNYHSFMSKKLALDLGIKKENIIKMDKPKDTRQEAIEAKKIIGTNPFILVTSASHMKRSMLLFEKLGLKPIAAPTYHLAKEEKNFSSIFSSENLYKVKVAFHEYLGLIWAYLKGYI
ncbi:ElyC/SanA/YdcF family protein [Poseidonibacter antarcticus]|uniref:ElyC/SanA/YdcF family protein n=1 Tax=Poseidonibacter antarcticus TaxID=2478538 RepID=UPI000EF47BAC|nr:ElyC/SanA/YdcF family protein [Poseidonibacter antarcticus]